MVMISNVNKTVFFVWQMDLIRLYENEFLEDYDERDNQSWEKQPNSMTGKFGIDGNLGATRQAPAEVSIEAMEYITALEERSEI